MPSDTTLQFLKRITSLHRGKSKYINWLTVHLERINEVDACAQSLVTEFDIDNAIGVQLDTLGDILGKSRNLDRDYVIDGTNVSVLDDETYRKILKSQVLVNTWDGKRETLLEIFQSIWPEGNVAVADNQDMSFDIYIGMTTGLQPFDIALLRSGVGIPKPAGVRLNAVGGMEQANMTEYTTAVARGAAIVYIVDAES